MDCHVFLQILKQNAQTRKAIQGYYQLLEACRMAIEKQKGKKETENLNNLIGYDGTLYNNQQHMIQWQADSTVTVTGFPMMTEPCTVRWKSKRKLNRKHSSKQLCKHFHFILGT